jgi:hypothetical protein
MVQLDLNLIAQARRSMDGANVHRVKQMIFAYEQAVVLHNTGWRNHETYQSQSEDDLRRYVARYRARCSSSPSSEIPSYIRRLQSNSVTGISYPSLKKVKF